MKLIRKYGYKSEKNVLLVFKEGYAREGPSVIQILLTFE